MSPPPTNPDPQVAALQASGLDVEIRDNHILVTNVPYVAPDGTLKVGSLVDPLTLNGTALAAPRDHTMYWIGDHPHRADGAKLSSIQHSSNSITLAGNIQVNHRFSARPNPAGKYDDFHHKFTTYYDIIARHAFEKDPKLNPETNGTASVEINPHPFRYVDTATARAEITAIAGKLRGQSIAIIGLGGTGSYILDFVSKTPVEKIHLFDGDVMEQHNAFRAPGAVQANVFEEARPKVIHHQQSYDAMHGGISSHAEHLVAENIEQLNEMDFAFICLDNGLARRTIVEFLTQKGIPFIDTGMGVNRVDDELIAMVRTTIVTPTKNDHAPRLPFHDNDANDYDTNIQIAELNALNAAFAVIRWKRFNGIYRTMDNEHDFQFSTLVNDIFKEEHADA